ncbi:MAG TPA: zinc ribbon domain-containing protein [Candidatus Binatia bacterium]|nr:zinc ribbon domain-containing protein [Candidatus Binatia bacterium]
MPIYEYRCSECGAEFEKLVDARTRVACPACAGSQVMRRLSLFRAVGARGVADSAPAAGGGGCCGGGCGCH